MKYVFSFWSTIKQLITVVCLVIILSTAATACGFMRTDNTPPPPTIINSPNSCPKEIVTVEQLFENPKNYPGSVCIEGIVSEVSPEQKIFTLIDFQEYRLCGTTGCALLTLPVQWNEEMPYIEDTVQVTGEVNYQNRNLVLKGQKLNIVHKK
jgi:hypothetical protein